MIFGGTGSGRIERSAKRHQALQTGAGGTQGVDVQFGDLRMSGKEGRDPGDEPAELGKADVA